MVIQNLEKEVSPIQLEDLLKLKRLERPDGHFWEDFDRKLEAKRLKILIKKEPIGLQWLKSVWRKHFRLVSAVSAMACAVFGLMHHTSLIQRSALRFAEVSSPFIKNNIAAYVSEGNAYFAQNVMRGAQPSLQVATLAVPCKSQVCYMNGGFTPLNTAKTSVHVSF